MRTFLLFCLLCSTIINLNAQNLPNPSFRVLETRACSWDASQQLELLQDWEIYQTLDGTWNGPVDSSICISVRPGTRGTFIDLDQVDITRPLFVKSSLTGENKPLLKSNWIYEMSSSFKYSENVYPNILDTCKNGLCSGQIFGIQIPDSTGQGFQMRNYMESSALWNNSNIGWNSTCFTTEYFEENYLRRYIMKFTFDPTTTTSGEWISLEFTLLDKVYDLVSITELEVEDRFYNGSVYEANFMELIDNAFWYDFLFLYTASTYPSADNLSFIDVTINQNPSTQETINIILDEYIGINFQPFTFVRGGLVEGSDSLRHTVNLINDGSPYCINTIVDFIFEQNTNYVHRSGQLHFNSKTACFQFREGSALIVDDDVTLQYGNNGNGILALRTGSTIKIGQNSTLVIDNLLTLSELRTDKTPQQIYMELNPGSKLIFGEYATVTNQHSLDGTMRLNIYMNGGELDDHHLSSSERALINRIYPDPIIQNTSTFSVFPNPSKDIVHLNLSLQEDQTIYWKIVDMHGRVIQSGEKKQLKGAHQLSLDSSKLSAGLHWIELWINGQKQIGKFIKR